jgi:hypothetical protein
MRIPRDPKLTVDSVETVEICLSSALALIFKGHSFVGFVDLDRLPEDEYPLLAAVVSLDRIGPPILGIADRKQITRAIVAELIKFGDGQHHSYNFRTSYADCIIPMDIEEGLSLIVGQNPSLFELGK